MSKKYISKKRKNPFIEDKTKQDNKNENCELKIEKKVEDKLDNKSKGEEEIITSENEEKKVDKDNIISYNEIIENNEEGNKEEKVKQSQDNGEANIDELRDDNNKKKVTSIKEYIEYNKKLLNEKKITLKQYLERIDVDDEKMEELLNSLLEEKKFKEFYEEYDIFQFKLKLNKRLYYQKYFDEKNLPDSIKKNIITNNNIKLIFQKICLEIIENINQESIENIFENNNVYFKKDLDIIIPYKYGTKELKFYCIMNDILNFFKSKKRTLNEKFKLFNRFKSLIKDIKNLNDEEIISIFNYLTNILYIFLEKGNYDSILLNHILNSCHSFNKGNANKIINDAKNNKDKFIKINGKYPYEYNKIDIQEKDNIELIKNNKIIINILAKYINWNHMNNDTFLSVLDSNIFMYCIRYPYNSKYNFFTCNEKLENHLDSLYHKMIKSFPVKEAMLFDEESKKLGYIFDNSKIFEEFENNVHLVILPFSNYHGYTDKMSFDIYLNVYIKDQSEFPIILSHIESFLISKLHEYMHGLRIYMRIFSGSGKKTPSKKFNRNIQKRVNETKDIIIKASQNYREDSIIFKHSTNEYGEAFEIALFGFKQEFFFLKSIIFCLTENSWKLDSSQFFEEFKKTMIFNGTIILEKECKEGLLKEIYNFFYLSPKNKYTANIIIETKSSNSNENKNLRYIIIPRESHYIYKDENNSWR